MKHRVLTGVLTVGVLVGSLTTASAGAVWTPPDPISVPTESGENPQVATSAHGNAVVVWQTNTASGERIVAAVRPPGGDWGDPHPVSLLGSQVYSQQVAMDAKGGAVAVWESAGRIQLARRPAGSPWRNAITVSNGHRSHFPDVATNARGDITVVWQKHIDGHDRTQVIRRPTGSSWSETQTISGAFGQVIRPQVAMDRRGAATVVWERMWADGGRSAAFVARRGAHGSWSNQLRLSQGTSASGPQVGMDRHGTAIVAWTGTHEGQARVKVTRRPAGGAWQPIKTLNLAPNGASLAELAMDTAGNATIAGVSSVSGDTRAIGWRRPAGGTWHGARLLSQPGIDVNNVQASMAAGYVIVIWETAAEVQGVERPAGGPWTSVEALSAGDEGFDPDVATDSSGQTVAAWKWFDGTKDRIVVTSRVV